MFCSLCSLYSRSLSPTLPLLATPAPCVKPGICGNNITSSALYVVALCAAPAGKYAPIALAVIAGLLYLFRRIYEEVVTALPVNGGTYNLLLNTTTKANASVAACLTMLSYVVTAVISATSAMRYIHTLCDGAGCVAIGNDVSSSVIATTLITLTFAGFLSIMGISESAVVALVIFCFHMLSMLLLVVASLYTAVTNMPTMLVTAAAVQEAAALSYNYTLPLVDLPVATLSCDCINATLYNLSTTAIAAAPDAVQVPMLVYNWVHTTPAMGIGGAIFFGYSSALLGISGFESSSNYVENQKPGVFPKTLRNMWVAVTFINPSVALLAQCLLPVDVIAGQAEEGALLSLMASKAAGEWLKVWIVVDATLVLVGAVITGFVGFTGLVHRMTVDRCLPQGFLKVNECRKTRHVIIGFYWFLTSALVLYTWGNVEVLAGVYTVAFLSVMFSFTVGNMLLKLRRSTLPTPVHVEWSIVLLANVCVAAGLIGNVISRPRSLPSLLIFGAVFILPVQIMLNRVKFLQIVRAVTTGVNHVMNAFQSPEMRPMVPLNNSSSNNNNSGGNVGGNMETMEPLVLEESQETKESQETQETKESQESKETKESKGDHSNEDTGGTPGGTQVDGEGETKTETTREMGTTTEEVAVLNTKVEIELTTTTTETTTETNANTNASMDAHQKKPQRRESMSLLKKSMSDANQLDKVFLECVKSVRELLDSDRATLWLIDYHNGVLWSKVAEGIPHIRVPMDKGIVGWVCTHNQTLNIEDAYKDDRFNSGVDQKTGYKTTTILCSPIVIDIDADMDPKKEGGSRSSSPHNSRSNSPVNGKTSGASSGGASSGGGSNDGHSTGTKMVGLIQVINKNGPEGVCFTPKDVRVLEDFCRSISQPVNKVQREDLTGDVLWHTVNALRVQIANVQAQLKGTDGTGGTGGTGENTTGSEGEHLGIDIADTHPSFHQAHHEGSCSMLEYSLANVKHPRRSCRCMCCHIPCCQYISSNIDALHEWSSNQILHLTKKPIVYFTKDDSPEELNTAIRYMLSNEQRRWIKFVRVFPNEESLPKEVPGVYKFLEYAYPEIYIEYTAMIGEFGPSAIRTCSYHTHVPTTFMFMGSFGAKFNFSFTELGGLRLITDNFVSAVSPTEITENKINRKSLLETVPVLPAAIPAFSPTKKTNNKLGEEDDEEDEGIILVSRSSSSPSLRTYKKSLSTQPTTRK